MSEDMEPSPALMRRIQASTVTLQLEKVRCGRVICRSCPHGPYWYAYWRKDGKTRSAYVGKDSRRALRLAEALFRYGTSVKMSDEAAQALLGK